MAQRVKGSNYNEWVIPFQNENKFHPLTNRNRVGHCRCPRRGEVDDFLRAQLVLKISVFALRVNSLALVKSNPKVETRIYGLLDDSGECKPTGGRSTFPLEMFPRRDWRFISSTYKHT